VVIVDGDRNGSIALPQARHAAHLDFAGRKLFGERRQAFGEARSAIDVASHVAADLDRDRRRLYEPVQRIEAGHLVQAVQRLLEPFGELAHLGRRQPTEPLLNLTQFLYDHCYFLPSRSCLPLNNGSAGLRAAAPRP